MGQLFLNIPIIRKINAFEKKPILSKYLVSDVSFLKTIDPLS